MAVFAGCCIQLWYINQMLARYEIKKIKKVGHAGHVAPSSPSGDVMANQETASG